MSYLVDTCVLSEARLASADSGLLEWLEQVEEHSLFVSVITFGEIQSGISRLEAGRRRRRLQGWLDQDLRLRFEGRILGLDLPSAITWGLLMGDGASRGRRPKAVDAQPLGLD